MRPLQLKGKAEQRLKQIMITMKKLIHCLENESDFHLSVVLVQLSDSIEKRCADCSHMPGRLISLG